MKLTLPKELTTITPVSRYLSLILFVSLPIAGFFLGTTCQSKYQANITQPIISCLQKSEQQYPEKTNQITPLEYKDTRSGSPTIIYRPVYIGYIPTESETRMIMEKTNTWKTYKSNLFSIKYTVEWEVIPYSH
jgi:hypothetical protein